MGEFFSFAQTTRGTTLIAVIGLILIAIYTIIFVLGFKLKDIAVSIMLGTAKLIGGNIKKREQKYRRDLEIGKVSSRRSKNYKFLNDLIIDLGYKRKGVTPYEFLFFLCAICFFICFIIGFVFKNMIMAGLAYPIILAGLICIMYTKSNIAHDMRIDAIMDAENIICNNIESGVKVAIRNNINAMPESIKEDFKDFIDNLDFKNLHIKNALMELNDRLGSVTDDFILSCISFETEQEKGSAGIFKDIVEMNNKRKEARNDMKHQFEELVTEFTIGSIMIIAFLVGIIVMFDILKHFYFRTIIGQFLLIIDLGLFIAEFVYITYLRAKEI